MNQKRSLNFILLLFVYFIITPEIELYAASPYEQLLESNSEVRNVDENLAKAYRNLRDNLSADDQLELRDKQRKWIIARDQALSAVSESRRNEVALEWNYRRIGELVSQSESVLRKVSRSGKGTGSMLEKGATKEGEEPKPAVAPSLMPVNRSEESAPGNWDLMTSKQIVEAFHRGDKLVLKYLHLDDKGFEGGFNEKTASKLEEKARQGDIGAQFVLGYSFFEGMGVEKNLTRAVEYLQAGAENGSARCQGVLGIMYQKGIGVKKDSKKAFDWFQKSADQGFALSQNNLGGMYENGEGVNRDVDKAFEWVQKGASQGSVIAQSHLGYMYAYGIGVVKNEKKGFECIQDAANQGYSIAQSMLGKMYSQGLGVARNETKAMEWYKKAAEQGDVDAKKIVAVGKPAESPVSPDSPHSAINNYVDALAGQVLGGKQASGDTSAKLNLEVSLNDGPSAETLETLLRGLVLKDRAWVPEGVLNEWRNAGLSGAQIEMATVNKIESAKVTNEYTKEMRGEIIYVYEIDVDVVMVFFHTRKTILVGAVKRGKKFYLDYVR
ncbi:MAG: tetratricopeptide repeat protein [Alphaproteobacteria bacterium]